MFMGFLHVLVEAGGTTQKTTLAAESRTAVAKFLLLILAPDLSVITLAAVARL